MTNYGKKFRFLIKGNVGNEKLTKANKKHSKENHQ
jgi:hypothetical protein